MAAIVRDTDDFFLNPSIPPSNRNVSDLKPILKHLKAQDLDREFITIMGLNTCVDYKNNAGVIDKSRKMAHFPGNPKNRDGFVFEADDFINLDKGKLNILLKKDNVGKTKKTLTVLAKTTPDEIINIQNGTSKISLTSFTDDHT